MPAAGTKRHRHVDGATIGLDSVSRQAWFLLSFVLCSFCCLRYKFATLAPRERGGGKGGTMVQRYFFAISPADC